MLARISLPLIILVALTLIAIDRRHLRRRPLAWRLLPLLPATAYVAWTLTLADSPNYFPTPITRLFAWLHVTGLVVAPAAVFALVSLPRWRRARRVAAVMAVATAATYAYGTFVETRQLAVRHIDYVSADLPEAFDGYRLVHVSDLHTGSYVGWRTALLSRAIDSINAQQADLVVLTGDLQNQRPDDIEPHAALLSTLHARDGVCSVLGNHDYALYADSTDLVVVDANLGRTRALQDDMGWTLLTNGHITLQRDTQHIVIAGMENDGEGRFPALGNINHTLWGVSRSDFVVMLQHDPTSWRRKILPHSHAQLTLSGHTHGGQLTLFGWSPASLRYPECHGLYTTPDGRALHVSSGLGAALPFRLGCPPEITVITLRRPH